MEVRIDCAEGSKNLFGAYYTTSETAPSSIHSMVRRTGVQGLCSRESVLPAVLSGALGSRLGQTRHSIYRRYISKLHATWRGISPHLCAYFCADERALEYLHFCVRRAAPEHDAVNTSNAALQAHELQRPSLCLHRLQFPVTMGSEITAAAGRLGSGSSESVLLTSRDLIITEGPACAFCVWSFPGCRSRKIHGSGRTANAYNTRLDNVRGDLCIGNSSKSGTNKHDTMRTQHIRSLGIPQITLFPHEWAAFPSGLKSVFAKMVNASMYGV